MKRRRIILEYLLIVLEKGYDAVDERDIRLYRTSVAAKFGHPNRQVVLVEIGNRALQVVEAAVVLLPKIKFKSIDLSPLLLSSLLFSLLSTHFVL